MVSTLLQMNSAFNDSDRNPSEYHAILHEKRSDENEEDLHCVSLFVLCLFTRSCQQFFDTYVVTSVFVYVYLFVSHFVYKFIRFKQITPPK